MNVTTFANRWKEFTLPGVGKETFSNAGFGLHVPCRIDRQASFFTADAANHGLPPQDAFPAMEETTKPPSIGRPAWKNDTKILHIGGAAAISLCISLDCPAADPCGSDASTALA